MAPKRTITTGTTKMNGVVKTANMWLSGEKVRTISPFMNQDGNGANQAVRIAGLRRQGVFRSKAGKAIFGEQSTQMFEENHTPGENTIETASMAGALEAVATAAFPAAMSALPVI